MKYLFLLLLLCLLQCNREKVVLDIENQPDSVQLFAQGTVSTGMYERDMAVSPDGREIIYTLGDYRQTRRCLVNIKKTGNRWGQKQILNFSGLYDDIEPFFSKDGEKLYFSSNRPLDSDSLRKDYNIWFTQRKGDDWQEPVPLPAIINSANDEFYPSVAENGNVYFTSVREEGIGSEDIFISRYDNGTYNEPEALDSAINSPTYEFNAYVTPDESMIIFTSYGRKDDMGGGDLYYSVRDSAGAWKPAINMGPGINSAKLDFCPFVDVPRKNFYFTSDRTVNKSRIENISEIEEFANQPLNGAGNIYYIGSDKVFK